MEKEGVIETPEGEEFELLQGARRKRPALEISLQEDSSLLGAVGGQECLAGEPEDQLNSVCSSPPPLDWKEGEPIAAERRIYRGSQPTSRSQSLQNLPDYFRQLTVSESDTPLHSPPDEWELKTPGESYGGLRRGTPGSEANPSFYSAATEHLKSSAVKPQPTWGGFLSEARTQNVAGTPGLKTADRIYIPGMGWATCQWDPSPPPVDDSKQTLKKPQAPKVGGPPPPTSGMQFRGIPPPQWRGPPAGNVHPLRAAPPPPPAAAQIPAFPGQAAPPIFQAKFDGDSKKLTYFIHRIGTYIRQYGYLFRNDRQLIDAISEGMNEGQAAEWIADLYAENAQELNSLADFTELMRTRFLDLTSQMEAENQIGLLKQAGRPVKELVWEFRRLAGKLRDWPERLLVHTFKNALDRELKKSCEIRGVPCDIQAWYATAIALDEVVRSEKNPPGEKKTTPLPPQLTRKPAGRRPPSQPPEGTRAEAIKNFNCFRCGRPGHRSFECRAPAPIPRPGSKTRTATKKTPGKPAESSRWAWQTTELFVPREEEDDIPGPNPNFDEGEDDPMNFCKKEEEGGHLVSIQNKREADFVAKLVPRKVLRSSVWIGLSAQEKSRIFKWSDGSRFNYKSWARGQPKNFIRKKNCVALLHWSGYRKWNNLKCRSKRRFICKYKPQGEGSTW